MKTRLKHEILRLLEEDARHSVETISTMLQVDLELVRETIAALEQDGVILKYRAVVDWEKAGAENVMALISVRVTPEREVGFDRVAARVGRFPEVKSVYLMSGTQDLAVVIEGRTLKDVASFVAHRLATIPGVTGTMTQFILKKYKQDGVFFGEAGEGDQRLVFAP